MFKIKPIPEDINDLRKKIKEEKPNGLKGIDADQLDLYPKQGENDKSLPWGSGIGIIDPGDHVDEGTTSRDPLIVLANQVSCRPMLYFAKRVYRILLNLALFAS